MKAIKGSGADKRASKLRLNSYGSMVVDGITGYARAQKTESEIVEKSYCSKGVRGELFT